MRTILFLLLLPLNMVCQNLTMNELINVKSKDLSGVEEFLSNKGWKFNGTYESDNNTAASVSFSYNMNSYSNLADAYINYYYDDEKSYSWINLQIFSLDKYNYYLNAIKGFGCKLINTELQNNRVSKTYRGKTLTFAVMTVSQTNEFGKKINTWYFEVYNNKDYKRRYNY